MCAHIGSGKVDRTSTQPTFLKDGCSPWWFRRPLSMALRPTKHAGHRPIRSLVDIASFASMASLVSLDKKWNVLVPRDVGRWLGWSGWV